MPAHCQAGRVKRKVTKREEPSDQTGEKVALRRRLQAQVETSALADFNGPPRGAVVADELPVVSKPKLRTDVRDVRPLPSVEPALPTQ